jgi:signal transduction histidine kinase
VGVATAVALTLRTCQHNDIHPMTVDPNESDSFDDIVRALDHDLRNPVSNILGYVDLLRDTPGTTFSGEQLEFLGRIEDNCKTLLDMLRRLRDIAIEQDDE